MRAIYSKTFPKIQDWSCVARDGYTAPERSLYVVGKISNHAFRQNGESVRTSRVVRVDGRWIFTETGSVYYLGRIDKKYLDYIKTTGRVYDVNHPIKVKEQT